MITFDHALAVTTPCDAGAAASAIVESARTAGGGVTILALGAMTNIAEAARQYPTEFHQVVRRVIFIGDTDPSAVSYNVALDPESLRAVLRSGVEVVCVGEACYPQPEWVEALFRESDMSPDRDAADAQSARTRECGSMAGDASAEAAATALRVLGGRDPQSILYDPLALLFHLHPDAFTCSQKSTAVPVRVNGDVKTADKWRFERCAVGSDQEPDGYVIEPSGVSLERYSGWLRQACGTGIGPP